MPLPGAGDDALDVGILRGPVQQAANLAGAGDKNGRVAGTAGTLADWDGVPGDLARNLDDLAHTEAFPTAQIADQRFVIF